MDEPVNHPPGSDLGSVPQSPPPAPAPPASVPNQPANPPPPPPIQTPPSQPEIPRDSHPAPENQPQSSDTFVIKSSGLKPPGRKNISFKKILPIGGLTLLGVIAVFFINLLVQNLKERQILLPQATSRDAPCDCGEVKAYDLNWNPVNPNEITANTTYRFAVATQESQSAYARFRINGKADPSWCPGTIFHNTCKTEAKKPDSNEFYVEYLIPSEGGAFTIEAQVYCRTSSEGGGI